MSLATLEVVSATCALIVIPSTQRYTDIDLRKN